MRKTKKSVSARFIRRKSGSIKRFKAGRRHLLAGKSRKRKRHARTEQAIDVVDRDRIGRMMPHG